MRRKSAKIDDNISLHEGLRQKARARREREAERAEGQTRAQEGMANGRRRNDLAPTLKLEQRAPSSLTSAKRRLRKIEPGQQARITAAIAELGFCAPVMIRADGEIIDGHVRVRAACELGMQEIPCVVVDHLSDEEVRVLRMALNRLVETGTWDIETLAVELSELIVLDAPLHVSGFDPPTIDILVSDALTGEHEGEEDPRDGPFQKQEPAVCRPGDIWALGPHRIICADARSEEAYAAIIGPGEVARIVLTDVPYNVPISGHVTGGEHREFAMASGEMSEEAFAAFNATWMQAVLPRLIEGGLLMSFIDWRSVELMIRVGRELGLVLLNLIVWAKTNAGMGSLWRSQHELLPVFKNGEFPHVNNVELGRNGRWRSNVWTYAGASSMGSDAREGLQLHPTVKPAAMLEDALLDVTLMGEIVIDPFLGSGSTLIAAQKTGRICRAIEIDPDYVDVAIRRWIKLTGQEPVLINPDDDASGAEAEAGAPKAIGHLQPLPPATALAEGGGGDDQ